VWQEISIDPPLLLLPLKPCISFAKPNGVLYRVVPVTTFNEIYWNLCAPFNDVMPQYFGPCSQACRCPLSSLQYNTRSHLPLPAAAHFIITVIQPNIATSLVKPPSSDESMTLFIQAASKQDRLSQLAKLDTIYTELLSHTGIRLTLGEEEEEVWSTPVPLQSWAWLEKGTSGVSHSRFSSVCSWHNSADVFADAHDRTHKASSFEGFKDHIWIAATKVGLDPNRCSEEYRDGES
jgi:hypothetical protein